jgi:hypothetical protein
MLHSPGPAPLFTPDPELADLFAALPPRAMIEAVNRRHRGEKWRPVLEGLTRRLGA